MLTSLMRIGWTQANPAFRQVFTMLLMPDGTPEQHQWFNDLKRHCTLPDTAVAMRQAVHEIDITEPAQTVHTPTLVLHAHDDAVVPFEEGRRLAALIPSARFVPLRSRNHILLETEPAWSQFLAEVRTFLANDRSLVAKPTSDDPGAGLTPAEMQVFALLARGQDNVAIGSRLGKSAKTVRNQVSSILGKLQVRTRAEAVSRARDAGIGAVSDQEADIPHRKFASCPGTGSS